MDIQTSTDEEAAHTFISLVEQLATSQGEQRRQLETEVITHLEQLFYFYLDANQLDLLINALRRTETAGLELPASRHQHAYFVACHAIESKQYSQAETLLHQLLQEATLAPALQARINTALGNLYDYVGQYDQALSCHRQSATIYQQLGDQVGECKALKNQGIVLYQLADYAAAQPLFERSLTLAQEVGDPVLQGRALMELGATAKEAGEWATATQYYQQSLTIWQEQQNRYYQAKLANNLGEIEQWQGHWAAAEAYFTTALSLISSLQDPHEAADMSLNLGFLHFTQGRWAAAEQNYQAALQQAQTAQSVALQSQIHYRLGQLRQRCGDVAAAYAAYTQAIDAIETMRERVTHLETRIGVMGTRQHVYQAMVLLCLAMERTAEAFTYVERARSRAFFEMVAPEYQETLPQPLTAAAIQGHLPADHVLVAYFATGVAGPSETMLARLPAAARHLREAVAPPERLLAFVVTNQTLICLPLAVDLPQIAGLHFSSLSGRLLGASPTATRVSSRWLDLDRQLLEPVRPYLYGQRHLILAPYHLLHLMPFHALNGHGQISNEDTLTVSYTPSASVLHKLLEHRSAAGQTEAVTIGYNSSDLEQAELEAQAIARQLQARAYVGPAANLATVQRSLAHDRVIHIACHAHFNDINPMQSALVLADGELTAAAILQATRLQADLVTLSACETGLQRLGYGDELFGFTRALLAAGARALLVTLWKVDDIATRLLMEHFYRTWLGGSSRAAALHAAQTYLQTLRAGDVLHELQRFATEETAERPDLARFTQLPPETRPFQHPYYWGAFLLIGDPR